MATNMSGIGQTYAECSLDLSAGHRTPGFHSQSVTDSSLSIFAAAGFDWLLVDHEHAPFELSDILAHLQAMAPYDVAPILSGWGWIQ